MNERKKFILLVCITIISISLVILMRANIGQEFIGQL